MVSNIRDTLAEAAKLRLRVSPIHMLSKHFKHRQQSDQRVDLPVDPPSYDEAVKREATSNVHEASQYHASTASQQLPQARDVHFSNRVASESQAINPYAVRRDEYDIGRIGLVEREPYMRADYSHSRHDVLRARLEDRRCLSRARFESRQDRLAMRNGRWSASQHNNVYQRRC